MLIDKSSSGDDHDRSLEEKRLTEVRVSPLFTTHQNSKSITLNQLGLLDFMFSFMWIRLDLCFVGNFLQVIYAFIMH